MTGAEFPTNSDFADLARVRGQIYGFLSLTLMRPPEKDFAKTLTNRSLVSSLASLSSQAQSLEGMKEGFELLTSFIHGLRGQVSQEVIKKLSVEYTRLFRGVKRFYGPPPPYESVYREGSVMGELTAQVSREYQEMGLALPDEYKGEPPDHISFELDFMRFLCGKEAEAWKNHNKKESSELVRRENRFLNEHLIKWVPGFCDIIIQESRVDFYRALAQITKVFITFDQTQITSFLTS